MQNTTTIEDLDTGDTLTGVESAVAARRAAEASLLHHAAHWADLHGDHDRVTHGHGACDDPGLRRGHPVFKVFGGEGTPVVAEFATAELGVSLRVHPLAARSWIADALDLRHRLPDLWALTFTDTAFEVWVLRKIAVLTRGLDPEAAELIGLELAGLIGSLPARRLLEKVESLVLLAEAEAAEKDRQDNLTKRFVAFNKSNQRGLKGLYAKLSAADAVIGEAQVQRLAQLLLAQDLAAGIDRKDLDSMAVARSRALGLLIANPDSALALIATAHAAAAVATDQGSHADDDEPPHEDWPADDDEPTDEPEPADESSSPGSHSCGSRWTPVTTVLHLHLSEDALQALAHAKVHGEHPAGVGRLEGHGPLTLPEALELLSLSRVVIRPVLDPWAVAPVDSYAFTGNLREAVLARVPADCYPYGVNTTHGMDIDHTRAYDPSPHDTGGPPGHTSIENAGPMTRHHHRIKTHGPMSVRQPVPDTYVWRTTHHRYRLVDDTGTHHLDPRIGALVFSDRADDREHAALLLSTGLDLGMEDTGPDDWELIA